MNKPENQLEGLFQDRTRNTQSLSILFGIFSLSSILYMAFTTNLSQQTSIIPFTLLVLQFLVCILSYFLTKRNQTEFAAWLLIVAIAFTPIPIVILISNIALIIGGLIIFEVFILAYFTLSRGKLFAYLVGLISFVVIQVLDQLIAFNRFNPGEQVVRVFTPLLSIVIAVILIGYFVNQVVRNRRVFIKLTALLGVFLLIVLTYSIYTAFTFDELKVTGPIYKNIITQKDLITDISPPTASILESHLIVLEILRLDATGQLPEELLSSLTSDSRAQRNVYESTMRKWARTLPANSELSYQVNNLAFNAAIRYFQARDDEFLPALREGNSLKAQQIFTEVMQPAYEEHIRAVDRAIFIARQITLENEVTAIEEADDFALTRIFIILGQIGLVLTIGLAIGQQITSSVSALSKAASAVSEGDLTNRVNIQAKDEFGQLAETFNQMTEQLQVSVQQLEQRVEERTLDLTSRTEELETATLKLERRAYQLQAVSKVAHATASAQNLKDLLPIIVNQISELFGFYHVGIFLIDNERKFALLEAANSAGGKKMLLRGHKLQVGAEGIVGYVTKSGQARIAFDVGEDATYFNNPDLPETRSEMALPLKFGSHIIGALDVQSTTESAFNEEDISVLNTLADQVAIAIRNVQLFEDAQRSIRATESTFRQYIRNEWSSYINSSETKGYQFSNIDGTSTIENNKTQSEIKKALQTGQEQFKQDNKISQLAIPLKLKGQVIGVLNVQMPNINEIDDDEKDIVRAIGERVTLAIENARLVEDSQRRASKEQLIGEITSKIGSSINMRNVLQTAVEELGRALPGSEVFIQFDADKNKKQG